MKRFFSACVGELACQSSSSWSQCCHVYYVGGSATDERADRKGWGLCCEGIRKCKKPHFQYNLYQECGFLSLVSQCTKALSSSTSAAGEASESSEIKHKKTHSWYNLS
eukprot:2466141-Rhodomonas_salina.1